LRTFRELVDGITDAMSGALPVGLFELEHIGRDLGMQFLDSLLLLASAWQKSENT
jgi:hypothetical protein